MCVFVCICVCVCVCACVCTFWWWWSCLSVCEALPFLWLNWSELLCGWFSMTLFKCILGCCLKKSAATVFLVVFLLFCKCVSSDGNSEGSAACIAYLTAGKSWWGGGWRDTHHRRQRQTCFCWGFIFFFCKYNLTILHTQT